jgi:hypothetical protein
VSGVDGQPAEVLRVSAKRGGDDALQATAPDAPSCRRGRRRKTRGDGGDTVLTPAEVK